VVPSGGKGEFHGLAVALVEDVVGDVDDVLGRLNGKDLVLWGCPLWDVEGVGFDGGADAFLVSANR
jgi:hypothetical protein